MTKEPLILAIGELLWDMLPEGRELGGAPANFIYYCNQLGVRSQLITAVGNDKMGEDLIAQLNYDTSLISVNTKPTSQVDVNLVDGIAAYNIREEVAWDYMQLNQAAKEQISNCHIFYFGSLAQRSPVTKRVIHEALNMVPPGCLRVFDVNLRQPYYTKELVNESLHKTDLLKINEDELTVLSEFFDVTGGETERLEHFREFYGLKWVALTKGSEGSLLVNATDVDYQPVIETKVIDTIGAGDSFLAGLVVGLLSGFPIGQAHKLACETSSFVCSHKGAMIPLEK